MADIRIKDLTTTASTTAADDFFAADGATNGTRKLSAYSPTFGGNATVGGTLTVTGALTTSSIVNNGANGVALDTGGSASLRFTDSATSKWWIYKLSGDIQLYFRDMVNARMQMVMQPGATSSAALTTIYSGVAIDSTTASTTTSSGALVVGNGTSGGLGVGGAVNIGGTLTLNNTLTCNTGTIVAAGGTPPSSGRGVELQHNGTNGYVYAYNRDTTSANPLYLNHTGGNLFLGNITSVANIVGTTASTSTSSGALVVSGGVGVAGRMHVNGVTTGGDNETHVTFVRNGTVSIGPDSTGTPALVVSTAIKTSAPSGGTAANWKLGTVATVSPTSPNRTIEVEIGGTTYYLHAKTTNN